MSLDRLLLGLAGVMPGRRRSLLLMTIPQSRRACRQLDEVEASRVVLTALDRGHRLADHRTAGRISIQTIAAHLTVHVGADTIDLPAGRFSFSIAIVHSF